MVLFGKRLVQVSNKGSTCACWWLKYVYIFLFNHILLYNIIYYYIQSILKPAFLMLDNHICTWILVNFANTYEFKAGSNDILQCSLGSKYRASCTIEAVYRCL